MNDLIKYLNRKTKDFEIIDRISWGKSAKDEYKVYLIRGKLVITSKDKFCKDVLTSTCNQEVKHGKIVYYYYVMGNYKVYNV